MGKAQVKEFSTRDRLGAFEHRGPVKLHDWRVRRRRRYRLLLLIAFALGFASPLIVDKIPHHVKSKLLSYLSVSSFSSPFPAGPSIRRPFRNCAEARRMGAAPVMRGEPGYGIHIDRDNDGIGCEWY